MRSILLEVFEKLRKARINKHVNPPRRKKKYFTFTLKPYQAYYLEVHIRNHMTFFKTEVRNSLLNVANQIHQKLA